MQYLILLYADESQAPEPPTTPEGFAAYLQPWADYSEMLTKAGVMRGGEALHDSPSAKTVTRETGDLLVTDGPFAETREQLGGFYLLECDTLEDAIKYAAQCPIVAYGRAEVRGIMDFSSAPS